MNDPHAVVTPTSGSPARPAACLPVALPALLLVVLAMFAAGCHSDCINIETTEQFNKLVAESTAKEPVLVMFWKFGCASCMFLDGGIEQLGTQYKGRVKVGKIMVMNLMFLSPFPEIKAKYEIGFVPVVILFVDGEEKQRWTVDYSMEKYHKALSSLVGPPQTQPASRPASQPADAPADPPASQPAGKKPTTRP